MYLHTDREADCLAFTVYNLDYDTDLLLYLKAISTAQKRWGSPVTSHHLYSPSPPCQLQWRDRRNGAGI